MIPAARPIPVGPTTGAVLVSSGLVLVTGWSFQEVTGTAPAQVTLFDGTSNLGNPFGFISLLAGESTRDLLPEPFLAVMSGLFVEVGSGEAIGSIWAIEATLVDGFAFAEGARPFWTGEL